jgi:metal-sulfur cluster biosynthetic enzyme
MSAAGDWEARVRAALAEVIDPCSCMTKTPVSIVDLGLVRSVRRDGDAIAVHLCMTDPMCMYFVDIASEIERRVGELGFGGPVSVVWDTDADWDPTRMTAAGRAAREPARERLLQIEPYAARVARAEARP